MDKFTSVKRSQIMSKVRSTGTKPEVMLRKLLFAKGYRYRLNHKDLPGSPDIVLPKYRTVIFVNGCFWHGHKDCKKAALPEENFKFWSEKISKNKDRDRRDREELLKNSWKVLTIWQCSMNKGTLPKLLEMIECFIQSSELSEAEIGRHEIDSYVAT